MDHHLLEIIACPICNGKLHFDKKNLELICQTDELAYPISNGIPVLLESHARDLSSLEKK
ncbi:hypothetical protein BJP41_01040 [Candidatus Williamhamiltonella defendens]|uniref:Methyltransferase activator Trm112 homolog n=2 Tax=Candidatus Williamhamiltonella defendens TaxID=138072 RepID=Y234_HAMD5|nr:Trm112 family protein [Candidatus Hamiltonella defensa]C4K359.1 RecName: Full=UPF0434 protein HDEF_0234 [Candidatus Hamiltonella defensa 5AT (Acyrthosiphon pisum)]ACQ67002.1 hypothetical protein HDEF_0234 [Candidatus Hamiltonella defensa 5AT (Acyrthosiphon pisum)]ASV33831.1 hypothetical protein CJJ18_07300 [Candidatus Hamiltonella defensa]ATW21794.1 hypothetical protein BJP44_01100 [Candidatus Hamiltonella defensa]ATW29163.1 hypothetical protein BJP41_01040 [Candidatus Hamiltonella defensa]